VLRISQQPSTVWDSVWFSPPQSLPFRVSRGDDQRRPAILGGLVRCGLEAQQVLHHREVAIIGRNVPGRKHGKNLEKTWKTWDFMFYFGWKNIGK
jgi:hypothetical protein